MSVYGGDVMCLVIPFVHPKVRTQTIFECFKNLGWGYISEIDRFEDSYKVFIHFSIWNEEFDYKRKFLQQNPYNKLRIYYNQKLNYYWNIKEAYGFRKWRYTIMGQEDVCDVIFNRPERCNAISRSSSISYDEPLFMNYSVY